MGKGVVLSALFAALISASFFIQIPIGGIPIVIQDMMSMLSGLMLGPLYGTLAVVIYLALGCLGLPVFSGKGGIQHLVAGPTAGFLIFYALGALFAGLLLKVLLPEPQEHSRAKSLIVINSGNSHHGGCLCRRHRRIHDRHRQRTSRRIGRNTLPLYPWQRNKNRVDGAPNVQVSPHHRPLPSLIRGTHEGFAGYRGEQGVPRRHRGT